MDDIWPRRSYVLTLHGLVSADKRGLGQGGGSRTGTDVLRLPRDPHGARRGKHTETQTRVEKNLLEELTGRPFDEEEIVS